MPRPIAARPLHAPHSIIASEEFPPLPSQTSQHAPPGTSCVFRATGGVSASAIMRLPDELWVDILHHLRLHCFSNYIRLSLVNRKLYYLVRNSLYVRYDSYSKQAYPFMRTIMSNQELGKLVRYVHFSYLRPVNSWETNGKKYPPVDRKYFCPTITDKGIVKSALKALNIPKWRDWATDCNDAINASGQEVLYTTILMYAPNIEKLVIDYEEYSAYKPRFVDLFRWTVNGGRFGRVHRFSHLRFVRVHAGPIRIVRLAPIFKLPALRRLKLVDVKEWAGDRGKSLRELKRSLPPVGTCTLECLTLDECHIGSDVIDILLQCIHSLRVFKHLLTGELDEVPDGPVLHYPTLSTSLLRFKNTLERISLGAQLLYSSDVVQGQLGDLSEFTSITHFQAPIEALADLKCLEQYFVPENVSFLPKYFPPLAKTLIIQFPECTAFALTLVREGILNAQQQGLLPSVNKLKFWDSESIVSIGYYDGDSDDAEMESDETDE
ncbi:hypothetical protein DM02DRAFT_81029 [Periconia macrospinosa]|uniref:F-box domain-containing protein n=1 Tax=Periconia macrospinosa TaxID=97972 RepID=A0A2V1DHB3_9PLEO|nr:hypothetical protein DM02DRAFT_81029 [Periconia macrospinosa]